MLYGPNNKQPELPIDPPRSYRERDDDPQEDERDYDPWGEPGDDDWDDEDDRF